jgi:hypothetical protein
VPQDLRERAAGVPWREIGRDKGQARSRLLRD